MALNLLFPPCNNNSREDVLWLSIEAVPVISLTIKRKRQMPVKKADKKAAVVSKTIPLKRQKQARKAVRSSHQRCK
jgi:hypothetical protein